MEVLITGGSGYTGSVISLELMAVGHDVTCLDLRGKPPGWEFWQSSRGRVRFLQGDVCNPKIVNPLAKDSDAIVHLAFVVGGPACQTRPEQAKFLAIEGTKTVIGAAEDKTLIFTSSDVVYGNKAQGLCKEDFPCEPASLYGELKLECEEMIRKSGRNFSILRLPSNFGVSPIMRHDLLVHYLVDDMFRQRKIYLYQGEVTRTLIHVRDVALAVKHVLEHQDQAKGVFNIASCSMKKIEMAQIIAEVFGGDVVADESDTRSDPEKRDFILDCSSFQDTGWRPRYSFQDGVGSLQAYLNSTQGK